jgi:hypothetical protein
MKREDLEALGMTKEQIDKVLDMHHTEYDPVKKELDTAQADLTVEKEKTATQEKTISGLKNDLGEFKDVDVSGLQKKITDLENDIKTKDAAHRQEISDRDFNDLLKESIAAVNGKNAKAITALLDVDTLKASKNQKEDISAALKALTEKEDSKMLFGEPDPNPVGTGNLIGRVQNAPGQSTDTLKDALKEKYK